MAKIIGSEGSPKSNPARYYRLYPTQFNTPNLDGLKTFPFVSILDLYSYLKFSKKLTISALTLRVTNLRLATPRFPHKIHTFTKDSSMLIMLPESIFKNDVLEKLYAFCAYQERCKQDVTKKLYKLEIPKEHHQPYLEHLEEEKFLNEERFAGAFARGKFRSNKWGRIKIRQAMALKGLPRDLIQEALESIKPADYKATLIKLLEAKRRTIKQTDPRIIKYKMLQYAAGKGYEPGIIYDIIDEIIA